MFIRIYGIPLILTVWYNQMSEPNIPDHRKLIEYTRNETEHKELMSAFIGKEYLGKIAGNKQLQNTIKSLSLHEVVFVLDGLETVTDFRSEIRLAELNSPFKNRHNSSRQKTHGRDHIYPISKNRAITTGGPSADINTRIRNFGMSLENVEWFSKFYYGGKAPDQSRGSDSTSPVVDDYFQDLPVKSCSYSYSTDSADSNWNRGGYSPRASTSLLYSPRSNSAMSQYSLSSSSNDSDKSTFVEMMTQQTSMEGKLNCSSRNPVIVKRNKDIQQMISSVRGGSRRNLCPDADNRSLFSSPIHSPINSPVSEGDPTKLNPPKPKHANSLLFQESFVFVGKSGKDNTKRVFSSPQLREDSLWSIPRPVAAIRSVSDKGVPADATRQWQAMNKKLPSSSKSLLWSNNDGFSPPGEGEGIDIDIGTGKRKDCAGVGIITEEYEPSAVDNYFPVSPASVRPPTPQQLYDSRLELYQQLYDFSCEALSHLNIGRMQHTKSPAMPFTLSPSDDYGQSESEGENGDD